MADICADPLACSAKAAHRAADLKIDFSAVCLSGDWIGRLESGFLGDEFVQLLDFVMVAVEDLEETCLRSSGTLHTSEP